MSPNPSQTQNAEFSFEDYFHHVVKEEGVEEQVEFFKTLSIKRYSMGPIYKSCLLRSTELAILSLLKYYYR
jgi:hypothetical protein